MESIYIKSQTLFSEKTKKNIIDLSPAVLAKRAVKVKYLSV